MKRILLTLTLALAALVSTAQAQTIGSFTFTTPGIYTNAVIVDPGSSTLELPSLTGNLELYLSAVALVNGKGTGNVTAIFQVSPDSVIWTSTNQTEFAVTWSLDGATNASVVHTNIDATKFRYLKLGGVYTTDEETAVTNLAVTYYRKRP